MVDHHHGGHRPPVVRPMIREFHHDGARYGVVERACVLNGRRMNQWRQWRLISGAYVLIRSIWLPPGAQRADVIERFSELC